MIGPAYLCGLIFSLLVFNTCAVKVLPDLPKPNAFSLLGLGTGCPPLLGLANTHWSLWSQISSPFFPGVFLQVFSPGVYLCHSH